MIQSIDPAACTGCGSCTKTCPLDVFRLETAQEQISPCMAACPAGVDIRGNHYLIQQGNLDEAARNYLAVQPFPAITGRVCFHPCESACARARVDSAVNINAVERFVPDLIAEGYQLVTVSELYEARGETLDPGTIHYRTDPTTEAVEETAAAGEDDGAEADTTFSGGAQPLNDAGE